MSHIEKPIATLGLVFAFVILVSLSSRVLPKKTSFYKPAKVITDNPWMDDPRLLPTRI
jgi:hypothetical protein